VRLGERFWWPRRVGVGAAPRTTAADEVAVG
jgi:hypothetical protein